MNRSNRHMQYRKRILRRRRIRLTLIIGAAVLVLAAIGFLVFGTLLAQKDPPAEDSETQLESSSDEAPRSLPQIQARPASLEIPNDSSTWDSRLTAVKKSGASAVSAPLNQSDGTLLYHSPTAVSLGRGNAEYTRTISDAVSRAKKQELYVCGVWHITANQTEDARLRSVRYAEEAAIIAEALENGLSDVLLLVPSWESIQPSELLAMEAQIRTLSTKGNLGFCLPDDLFAQESPEVLIDDLIDPFDYLAIDGTCYGEQVPASYVESVASKRLNLLLRYQMRLLLPTVEDSTVQDSIIAAAEQYNAKNWQILS